MAASRTMSPSRASEGGDCTTLSSQAGWGRGAPRAAMCSLPRPPGGVSPRHEQSTARPPPSRNGVALPYLRPLTPEGKWTCPSAVCQLPGLCGKMDPPARRRVGSRCLTRPLLGVRLGPGRQENQHTERPASSAPPRLSARSSARLGAPGRPPLQRVVPSEPPGTPSARALPPPERRPDPLARTTRAGGRRRCRRPPLRVATPPGARAPEPRAPSRGDGVGGAASRRASHTGTSRLAGQAPALPPRPPGPGLPAWLSRITPGRGGGRRPGAVGLGCPPPPPRGALGRKRQGSSLNLLQKSFLPGILTRRHDP